MKRQPFLSLETITAAAATYQAMCGLEAAPPHTHTPAPAPAPPRPALLSSRLCGVRRLPMHPPPSTHHATPRLFAVNFPPLMIVVSWLRPFPAVSSAVSSPHVRPSRRYGNDDGSIPATFQVIYLLGWKPDTTQVRQLRHHFTPLPRLRHASQDPAPDLY